MAATMTPMILLGLRARRPQGQEDQVEEARGIGSAGAAEEQVESEALCAVGQLQKEIGQNDAGDRHQPQDDHPTQLCEELALGAHGLRIRTRSPEAYILRFHLYFPIRRLLNGAEDRI